MLSRRFLAVATSVVVVGGLSQFSPATGSPAPADRKDDPGVTKVDRSLGNGLGWLLAGNSSAQQRLGSSPLRVNQGSAAVRDDAGRVLVHLTPQVDADRAAFRRLAERQGLRVTATDGSHGTLEGYAPLSAVRALAALDDTGTISMVPRPVTRVGSTTSQGVAFQRVDKVHGQDITGQGMTIGVLSDSYDTADFDVFGEPLAVHAEQDIASGDLPGPGNERNSQPVVVIEDGSNPDTDTDEGRGMLQIVHDIAPDAKLCFATAFGGEVGFADNIRALADPAGPCDADVIVDDVGYFSASFFADDVIADAVDDVAAQGVAYFSSAGNDGDNRAWQSKLRLVSKAQGVKGTNLDFSEVDPALYAGGLQDMDPGPGTDVAQTLRLAEGGGGVSLQWNEGADPDGPEIGAPYLDTTGEVTEADPEPTFEFTPTPEQLHTKVLVTVDGIPSGTTDLILALVKPDGTEVGPIDTGASPEKLTTELDQEGTYKIIVSGFNGDTGDFTLKVEPILAPSEVTQDFNILAFGPDGTYFGSLGDDNTLTGLPAELQFVGGVPELQMVIARATTGPTTVDRLHTLMLDGIWIDEYFDPSAPATYGHPAAAGAIGVGAYDPFRSFLPEWYTSPGGRLKIQFDSEGNAFDQPQVRQKPEISATDRGNTTFFVADDARDSDEFPNFGGTSASAPHAAAIAALMIQKAGGPGSMTPDQVRAKLQRSTFGHDLDPNRASGAAKGLRITAIGHQGDERNPTAGSMTDRNFFRVSYHGKVPIRTITLLGETASPTSLRGIVFDPRKVAGPEQFREGGFPFKVGDTHRIKARSIKAHFTKRFGALPKGVFQHLTLRFGTLLRKKQSFGFGIDRDAALWAPDLPSIEGNGADELGGAYSIPSGKKIARGMVFRAVLANGKVIRGRLANRLGHGWTPIDGYGLVNAEQAVLGD
jgi:hypothetical protein